MGLDTSFEVESVNVVMEQKIQNEFNMILKTISPFILEIVIFILLYYQYLTLYSTIQGREIWVRCVHGQHFYTMHQTLLWNVGMMLCPVILVIVQHYSNIEMKIGWSLFTIAFYLIGILLCIARRKKWMNYKKGQGE